MHACSSRGPHTGPPKQQHSMPAIPLLQRLLLLTPWQLRRQRPRLRKGSSRPTGSQQHTGRPYRDAGVPRQQCNSGTLAVVLAMCMLPIYSYSTQSPAVLARPPDNIRNRNCKRHVPCCCAVVLVCCQGGGQGVDEGPAEAADSLAGGSADSRGARGSAQLPAATQGHHNRKQEAALQGVVSKQHSAAAPWRKGPTSMPRIQQ